MPVNHGALQDYSLTLDKFIDHAARWHSDKCIVTARNETTLESTTYAQIAEDAHRVSELLADCAVGSGDCVATLAWNSAEHVIAWYGIMGMGAVCHTLNPRLAASDLADMLRQSRARVLIASSDLLGLAQDLIHDCGVETIFVIDDENFDASSTDANVCNLALREAIKDKRQDYLWGDFPETTPCGLCFTSGTTGDPKGVTYTHRGNYLHTLRQLQADVGGFTERDVVLQVVPMFHANGWGLPFSCPAVGAELILPGRDTDGASLARLILERSATIAVGVPTVWLDLFDHADKEGIEFPTLKRLMVGGAPMPAALTRRILDRGIAVQQTWGMTELSPLGTAMLAPYSSAEDTHSGHPAMGLDIRLADHEGRALDHSNGEQGKLLVRGPSVVERYFGEVESAIDDGWFDTGDLAQIDGEGQLHITGRAKDLIKSGGEWVNPGQIESAVGAIAEVSKVAVIARAHDKWGERPVMVVELAQGAAISDDALLDPIRQSFATWWVPDEVIRVPSIPLAATGKIDKQRLRAQFGSS